MIPNPTKEIVVPFNIEDVKKSIYRVSNLISNCTFKEYDETLNMYKFQFSEFMSFGSYLIVNLTGLTNNTTKLNLEFSRLNGAYDNPHEITNANEQLSDFLKNLSILLKDPNYIPPVEPEWYEKNSILIASIFLFWPLTIFILYKRFTKKKK